MRSGHGEEEEKEEDEKIARIRLFSYQNNLHRERFFSSLKQTKQINNLYYKKIYIYIKSVFFKAKK